MLLKLGEKEEAARWKGVRVRLVKSREAVILHGWREKVSTRSQRTSASSPSPPLRSLRWALKPSRAMEGCKRGRMEGGRESPGSPAGALIHRGFSHQPHGVLGPRPREGRLSLKPQHCQKLIAAALLFNYQFKVECCCSLGWI